MSGRYLYSSYFEEFCFQNLFHITRSIFMQLPSSFFSICLVSVHVVHPYNRMGTSTAWKNLRFILWDRSDFHMTTNPSIAIHLLYIDLRPGQTCHSKDAEVAYSIGVGELGWQYGTGLKFYGTNWCTGRGWPGNCMRVISAWWRSNMPFQRLSGRLNYYITR